MRVRLTIEYDVDGDNTLSQEWQDWLTSAVEVGDCVSLAKDDPSVTVKFERVDG